MARPKKTEGPTMSDEIRALLRQDPKMKPADIISTLAEKGLKVKPSLVYIVKGKEGKKRRRARRAEMVETANRMGASNPAAAVISVKKLAMEVGGLRILKQLVDAIIE